MDFLFSANPGIEPRPLRNIASGGELSRIMLAIQAVLHSGENQPVLVFDEIDSEIGGRLGSVIGNMMLGIRENRQIICITHLPQLACFGDTHYRIDKNLSENQTEVTVQPLDEESRILELAQMLGGESFNEETTLNEVKHMLENVKNGR
jgi:DNA repair protein RecN (Recombination protein N)